jgi:flagellar hook-length control protein FliK
MLSPDLLGILMRGLQARHHDWGMTLEGAPPEEDFAALIEATAGGQPAGASRPPLAEEETAPAEAPMDEAAAADMPAAAAPDGRGEARGERDGASGAATRPNGETMQGAAEAGTQPAPGPGEAAEAEAAAMRPPRDGGSSAEASPAPGTSGSAAPAAPSAPSRQAVAAGPDALAGWRLGGEGEPAIARAAGAAAGAPGSTGASPAGVAGQVAVAIAGADGERVEIRLDPPELGRVQITMRVIDGALTAVVLAERPEVADMLRRHAGELERDLAASGYEDVSLDFGEGRDEAPDEPAAPPVAVAIPKGERLPLEIPPAARHADGRLDIRL